MSEPVIWRFIITYITSEGPINVFFYQLLLSCFNFFLQRCVQKEVKCTTNKTFTWSKMKQREKMSVCLSVSFFAPLSLAPLDWKVKVFPLKLSSIFTHNNKTQAKIPEFFSIFSIQIKSTANKHRKVVLIVKSNSSEIPLPPYR